MLLHFDEALVRRLFEHSRAAPERNPNFEQLFDGRYRKDGKDFPPDAEHSPSADDVDKSKIPPGTLWLVGDSGVYLMSPGQPGLREGPGGKHLTCPADEVNADTLPFGVWWERKRASYGGDDGCDALAPEMVETMLRLARDGRCELMVTPQRIAVLEPPNTKKPRNRKTPRKKT